MKDQDNVSGSNPEKNIRDTNNPYRGPIKQCYLLANKYFIVIDKSILTELNLTESISELYFQQIIGQDGSIILRPFKLRK